jgi:bifunctional NMN adenylyltransferase/nudix hydrolase
MDTHDDGQWSRQLDLLVRALCPIGTVCMYGGRDSFIKQYTGSFDTFELGISDSISGTSIREDTGKTVLDTVDFRRGIIWACQNQYPKVYPTVDIAVWRPNDTGKSTKRMMLGEVLMARRTQDDLLQFPGGFVDPTDESLESAAQRELSEELDVSAANFTYVGSCRINDWRYTGTERIHTVLMRAEYEFGSGKPIDEFHSSQWVQVRPESLELVKDGHKPLFDLLLRSQNG